MTSRTARLPEGVVIRGRLTPAYADILSAQALAFVAKLARKFEQRRRELMAARTGRQAEFDAGRMPDFLAHTKSIRDSEWIVAPVPRALQDRRVEITGPTERKMVINALNCGASVFMADFEDSNTPTWENMIEGQVNLRDAINRTITYVSSEGRRYELNANSAALLVRPRG
ncbi:MAG TPA: malate synthase A, partial [Burkholderiales bacterium]|nr:malate synthase A [Burkholderiales bacterium]